MPPGHKAFMPPGHTYNNNTFFYNNNTISFKEFNEMEFLSLVNINPGLKTGSKQAFTIMAGGRTFFVTYNDYNDQIEWNMYIDDTATKTEVEKILRNYLTNQ